MCMCACVCLACHQGSLEAKVDDSFSALPNTPESPLKNIAPNLTAVVVLRLQDSESLACIESETGFTTNTSLDGTLITTLSLTPVFIAFAFLNCD